ncbi:hypothetical protein D1007_38833 [Hordeum vulgare]|nr:hypothetical protein D1007_38833 [Hordeum vulgare]
MAWPSPWPERFLAPIVAGLRATRRSWPSFPPPPPPPWSELPPELLGLILADLPDPADRARFQLRVPFLALAPFDQRRQRQLAKIVTPTCQCQRQPPWRHIWRSVFPLRRRRQHPWLVLQGGFFLEDLPPELSDVRPEPIASFPENLRCVGSTGSWLALDRTDGNGRHAYFLHNPFSRATVPLPELDAVAGDVSELFTIRKVLMRSTPEDLIVVMTNNLDLPIFSVQRGKGVLLPQPGTAPYDLDAVFDIAFLGDKLYGLDTDGIVTLPITFDDDHSIPMATSIEQLIWSDIDDADVAGDDEDDDGNNNDDEGDEENNGGSEKEKVKLLSEEDKAKRLRHIKNTLKASDGKVGLGIQFKANSMIFRYLVESCGKLFMVIREADSVRFTYKVEVFVFDVNAATWHPVSGGLGGQTFFISRPFSKSVLARGEVEPDAIYFADFSGEFFCMKSSQARHIGHFRREGFLDFISTTTWIFPPH